MSVDVEAVVDRRLEDRDRLPGDLGAAEAAHQLLALAGEHRAADDLEPAAGHRVNAHHGRKPRVRGRTARYASTFVQGYVTQPSVSTT